MRNKDKRLQELEKQANPALQVVIKWDNEEEVYSCSNGKFESVDDLTRSYSDNTKFQFIEVIWEEKLKEMVNETIQEFENEY